MGGMAMSGARHLAKGERPALRDVLLTPANMRRVANELAHMRGAAMKIGQLMSMDTGDVLPPELVEILARLRSDAHFMPQRQLKQVLIANWGSDWMRHFARFDVRPIAAASIGQVHRAQLRDGRDVAVKVQYPGVARSIDSDVSNVGALVQVSGLLPAGFDLAPYLDEARRQLREETDYLQEGRYLTAYSAKVAADDRFVLPELYGDWTTSDILVISFVEGRPIEDARSLPQADRDRIATDLIDLLLAEVFRFGLMQTDPNFANYRYNYDTRRIVLLDFGATRRLKPATSALYHDLMSAGLAQDTRRVEQAATALGVIGPDIASAHRAQILTMIQTVFDALRAGDPFDFATTKLSDRLQVDGMALAEAGFVPPPLPMDVLYLQRKFGGIFLLANRLQARVPVRALLESYLAAPAPQSVS